MATADQDGSPIIAADGDDAVPAVTPSEVLFGDMRRVAKAAGYTAGFGAVAILGYTIASATAAAVGATLLWMLAVLAAGGVLGFLFGIPKVVQGARQVAPLAAGSTAQLPDMPAEPSRNDSAGPPPMQYQQRVNTNLEDISDWLTKIIVGLGLVQLGKIGGWLHRLSSVVALGIGGDTPGHHSAAMALIIYGISVGAVFGYLMTRLYIQGALARAEQNVTRTLVDVLAQVRLIDRRSRSALTAAVRGVVKKPPTMPDGNEAEEELWKSDPHKGKFGGKSESNGRRLTASITPAFGLDEATCEVHLQVVSTDPMRPLAGVVTFFLHPTFTPDTERVSVSPKGVAEFNTVSDGEFTVGVETDAGQTRLELDLDTVRGGTPAFYAQ